MSIKGRVKWPVGVDFEKIPTPGRTPIGELGQIIRLQQVGCANRPVFHIQVTKERFPKWRHIEPLEQVGTYDPFVNAHGEKLVSLNIERINHFLAKGIKVETHVAMLLGLAGLLPQHPRTYMAAWRNREELEYLERHKKDKQEDEN